jgi:hypothetical protein
VPPNGPVDVDNSRTIGVLLAFSVVGIGLVSGILIYIWHKSKTDESSKYVTLSDRLGSNSRSNSANNLNRPSTSWNSGGSANFTNINRPGEGGPSTSNSNNNPFAPQFRGSNFVNRAFELDTPQTESSKQTSGAVDYENNKLKFDQFNNKDKDRNSETSF